MPQTVGLGIKMVKAKMVHVNVGYEPRNKKFGMWVNLYEGYTRRVAEKLTIREATEVECIEPIAQFEKETMQELFDDLWNLGFRPSDANSDPQRVIESLNNHLNDMRFLLFSILKQKGIVGSEIEIDENLRKIKCLSLPTSK